MLGTCWITNYGLPDESQCSGSNQYFSYNNGGNCSTHSCTWLDAPGKSDWLSKVNINGSGKGISGIFYTKDYIKSCCGGGSYPLDLRRIGAVEGCPACSSYQLSNDLTIAKHQDKTGLYCGDQIYIHNEGIHILTDTGNQSSFPPGYNKDHWFDHYVGCIPCSFNVGSRSRMCIKLY